MGNNKKRIKELLEAAFSNAKDDRDKANSLLKDVSVYIGTGNINTNGSDKHREVGIAASKYLDNLTKSNDQIIKIAELLKKTIKEENAELSDEDKADFYEEIEENDDPKINKEVKEDIEEN